MIDSIPCRAVPCQAIVRPDPNLMDVGAVWEWEWELELDGMMMWMANGDV